MEKHLFIFEEGLWIGEGDIGFSTSPEQLHFYTRWQISKEDNSEIKCKQVVEMQGSDEHVENQFVLSKITKDSFVITLENDMIGLITGTGVISDKAIAWEFRKESGLEGFETFTLQEGGDYLVHSEYASQDQFRSIIDGKVWKK